MNYPLSGDFLFFCEFPINGVLILMTNTSKLYNYVYRFLQEINKINTTLCYLGGDS